MNVPLFKLIASENTAKSVPQYNVVDIKLRRDQNEFWIGRHVEADLTIMDIAVSRKHACLKYLDNCWFVFDNRSSNGVSVNDAQIPIEEYIRLKNDDKISIQNGANNYEWVISTSNEDMKNKSLSESILIEKEKIAQTHKETVIKIKEEKNNLEKKAIEIEKEKLSLNTQKEQLRKIINEEKSNFASKQAEEYAKFEANLRFAKDEVIKTEKAKFELRIKEEKMIANNKLEEKEKRLQELVKKAESRIEALENEKDSIAISLEFEMEQNKEKIGKMKKDFDEHIKQLSKDCEKAKTTAQQHKLEIEDLKKNFNDVLKQSAKENEDTVGLLKSDAERDRKERECLQKELKERDEELAKMKEALKLKQNSKANLQYYSICNEELKCSICDELFIEPMSLGCGHVYCNHCLKQWEVNCGNCFANFNCPNCREPITTFYKSLQLENLITALFKGLGESIQLERENLIKERKSEERAAKEKLEAEKRHQEEERRERSQRRRRGSRRTVNSIRQAFERRLIERQGIQRESTVERRRNLQDRVREMRERLATSELRNLPQRENSPITRSRVSSTVNSIRQRLITEMATRVSQNDIQIISQRSRQQIDRNQSSARSSENIPPVIDLEAEMEIHQLDTSGEGEINLANNEENRDESESSINENRSRSRRSRSRQRRENSSSEDTSSDNPLSEIGRRSRSTSRSSTSSQSSSSSELNLSDSSDSSSSSVEGISGFYYGGYGECFNCGRRGHWAPGCPF